MCILRIYVNIYMDINGHPMPQNHPEPRLYIYIYNTHPQILNAAVIMMIMAHLVTMSLN